MFGRSRYPSSSSYGQGAYTRLQQQDDLDDDYDDQAVQAIFSHHPNTVIVANDLHCAIAPTLPKPSHLHDESDTGTHPAAEEPPSFSARASFSAKRAADFPRATRQFISSKLPFRKNMATEASFASMPAVIMADIQNGDLPRQTDPMLKELPARGWTVVRRRRLRGRRRMLGHRKKTTSATPLAFDESLLSTDPISTSVFIPWDPSAEQNMGYSMTEPVKNPNKGIPLGQDTFNVVVETVRTAIAQGVQPTRISQGSSGSYFSRDSSGKIVGVFKPKNEEPYGRLNPKWTKWIHRHLFPCFFGRSCLIPNLGYISEAGASLIDRRLGTFIVPHTDVIHLASSSFHYDYLDRRAASTIGLPPKIGSYQCFLDGFVDANQFLRDHPFPDDRLHTSSLRLVARGGSPWAGCLGQDDEDDVEEEEMDHVTVEMIEERYDGARTPTLLTGSPSPTSPSSLNQKRSGKFRWTRRLQEEFKLEFEQLVILDYLIRNTDRGLDNWMIKYIDGSNGTSSPGSSNGVSHGNTNTDVREHIHVAAIDNGLAFPFKHPDQWRSYPYGWLALPETLVGRPFSESTRRHFLTVLSDPLWWRETVQQLRKLFQTDADFDERMFQRQMAVLKGQGFNIVRTLSKPSATPMDLVAAERVLVNQEEILIEYDETLLAARTRQDSPPTIQEHATPSSVSFRQPLPPKRRLRTKRSTSFDVTMHARLTTEEDNLANPVDRSWRPRMSLDLGHQRKRRSKRRLRLNFRHAGSDGENHYSDSASSSDDEDSRRRITIIMETIEVVKSKTYFTCC